jgi:hypothetical protein
MSDKDQQTEDKDPFDLSPESPFSSEAMASVTDERFTNSKKFGQDMNGLTLNDEDLIRQVMKEQKQRKKHRRKTEKAAKQKRKDNRGRARKMKERKVKVAKEELEEAKQQQTTHVKRRLTALERETMKRYGLYHNIHEFMHKDENNARPIAKLLDQLVDRIQRRQSTASRVESFKMFLPRVNNRGKITRDSLREGIKAVGLKFMDEEADSVFDQVDKNGDGNLDYNEFVQALMGDKPQMLRNVSQDVVDKLRGAQKRQLQMLRHMGQGALLQCANVVAVCLILSFMCIFFFFLISYFLFLISYFFFLIFFSIIFNLSITKSLFAQQMVLVTGGRLAKLKEF